MRRLQFEGVKSGQVLTHAFLAIVVGVVLWMALAFCYGLVIAVELFGEVDTNLSEQEQQDQLNDLMQERMNDMTDPGSSSLLAVTLLGWGVIAAATFFFGYRAARSHATSLEQAGAYGLGVGGAVILFLGLCLLTAEINILWKLVIAGAVIGGGMFGGQMAGPAAVERTKSRGGSVASMVGDPFANRSSSPQADTYFNMGVAAALGGRRQEAREHFSRVINVDPRHVKAWLQLANLSDTPQEAWNYIQNARAIAPNDPDVINAVNVIGPQVGQSPSSPPPSGPVVPGILTSPPGPSAPNLAPPASGDPNLPSSQPLYPGAPTDDENSGITFGTLPDADDAPDGDRDQQA